MKKKLLLLSAILCIALLLSACGGSPLAKANKKIASAAENDSGIVARYSEANDTLEIIVEDTDHADKAFEILNEVTEGKDIGRLCFDAPLDSDLDYIVGKAGELKCNSIATFGLGTEENSRLTADWDPLLQKAGLIYFDFMPGEGEVDSSVLALERIALGECNLSSLKDYDNLKEAAVGYYSVMHVPEETAEDAAEVTDGTEEGTENAAEDSAAEDTSAESEEQAEETGSEEATPVFSGGWVSSAVKSSNLERLLIMPQEKTYTTDEEGDAYLFYLQNYKPDLLVNAPGSEVKYDSEGAVDPSSLKKVSDIELTNLSDARREEIIKSILGSEAHDVYKKSAKYDSAGGDPVIKGKALVLMVDPDKIYDEIDWWNEGGFWPEKKTWCDYDSFNAILTSSDLGGKIKTPEKSGDYETFVYAYPVYSHIGSYSHGTKAYRLTYYCQVFDLKNKKAYGTQKITSVEPPQTIYYSGKPQEKASGKIDRKKVINFIKDIKTK